MLRRTQSEAKSETREKKTFKGHSVRPIKVGNRDKYRDKRQDENITNRGKTGQNTDPETETERQRQRENNGDRAEIKQ